MLFFLKKKKKIENAHTMKHRYLLQQKRNPKADVGYKKKGGPIHNQSKTLAALVGWWESASFKRGERIAACPVRAV
jgi:hypothetical protein